jgi:hypothetical protein
VEFRLLINAFIFCSSIHTLWFISGGGLTAKLLRKLCCLLLVFLLFLSFPQATKAAILEDEGTEGNASEYRDSDPCTHGIIQDETRITKVGNYSLKCSRWDAECYLKRRTLSSSFRWGDFNSLTLWVYRGHHSHESITIRLYSGDNWVSLFFDISRLAGNTWQQYNKTKEDISRGSLKDGDIVTHLALSVYADPDTVSDFVYLDGLDIYFETSSDSTFDVIMPETAWYLFGGIASAGIAIALFIVVLKTDRLSNLRKKRLSEKTSKLNVRKEEVAVLKTVEENRCAFCGEKLRITEDMQYCPWCGMEIPQCIICLLSIVKGDDFVKCPYCESFAHRNHLVEWVKVKGSCPYCKERLTEFDIPT